MSRTPNLLKVLLLGDGGVGKSCLMNRYVTNNFDENSFHTIGVEFLCKDITINSEDYTLQIWDTAGQERFKSLRTPFYRGADIGLLVYGVDDRPSFDNLTLWKQEFLNYADVKDPHHFPFIVLGNKVDVPKSRRQVSLEEGLNWCQHNGDYPHLETSAKDSRNVNEAFTLAVEAWASLDAKREKKFITDTVDLSKHSTTARTASESSSSQKCCLNVTS